MTRVLATIFFYVALAIIVTALGFAVYGFFWVLWAFMKLLGPG
jgi:hypothetical protein